MELEVQVGPQAEEMLTKKINPNDEEITEGKPVLIKLKQLLNPTVNIDSSVNRRSNSRCSDINNSSASSISSTSSRQRKHVIKVGAWEMLPQAVSK